MSTPRCIALDVFEEVGPCVGDNGVCPSTPEGRLQIIQSLSLAQSAIVKRADTEGLLWDFYVPVYQGCFALPIDCESDRNIFVNGFPAVQRDQWYEGKLAWGQNNVGNDCRLQCIDQGQFVIPLPLPKAHSMRIALIAEANGDAGKQVQIEVINQHGDRVQETLTLKGDGQPVVTNSMVYDVSLFNKPLTLGAVQMQVHYDTGQRFMIGGNPVYARYGPKVRHGYFRRKKLPQMWCGCNMVMIKGKLRSYPITSENDILPFADVHAWRWGVMAVNAEQRGDAANYDLNIGFAIRELSRSMQDSDPAGNRAQAKFTSGFGASPSWAGGRGRCWN